MFIDLKCTLINAENLFLLFDEPLPSFFDDWDESAWQSRSTSLFRNKSLQKTRNLAKTIQEMDPDLILLTEVGGEESLKNFNQYFLSNNYRIALIEGNSDRSIDVGFLVHKRLSCHFDILSNKERPLNFWYRHERNLPQQPSQKFSRDVAELHLFTKDISKPFVIFLLTHLKSPLDPEGIDPLGTERREAEFKALLSIYNQLNKRLSGTPIVVCGDFNGNASQTATDREFLELYTNSDLIDICDVLQIDPNERPTFFPLKSGNLLPGKQIDYVFINSPTRPFLKGGEVYRYAIEGRGRPLGPLTVDERLSLPSDHYPLYFSLRLPIA